MAAVRLLCFEGWGGLTCCWGWGQERVDSNGVTQHAHNSTLITPFTITATYFPERAGPTIITATQMKWIIVSLCGTSGNGGEKEREKMETERQRRRKDRWIRRCKIDINRQQASSNRRNPFHIYKHKNRIIADQAIHSWNNFTNSWGRDALIQAR